MSVHLPVYRVYSYMVSSHLQSLVISEADLNAGVASVRLNGSASVTTIGQKGHVTRQSTNQVETLGRAAAWAVNFDRLLLDDIGLNTFAVSF